MADRLSHILVLGLVAFGVLLNSASGDNIQWTGGTSTDFEVAGNWVGTTTPPTDNTTTDTAVFAGVVPANEPLLTMSRSIARLNFTSAGWNIFGSGPVHTLTVGAGGVDSAGAGANVVGASGNLVLEAGIVEQIWNVSSGNTLQIDSIISGGTGMQLKKAGAGLLSLRSNNPYDAATDLWAGRIELIDNGSITANPYIIVRTGAELVLDNTGTTDLGDRLPDASNVSMYGGMLEFKGRAGTTSTETMSLRRGPGSSEVVVTPGAGAGAELTIASLVVGSVGGDIDFVDGSGTLGDPGNNPRIFLTGQGAGFIGGWATVNRADFASYDLIGGIELLPGVRPGQVEGGVVTDDVKTTSAQTTLTGDTTINSLVVTGAWDNDLGGHRLDVNSGGILKTNNTTYSITNGRLTAGAGSAGELFAIISDNTTTISANIVDNGGAVCLVKSGAGRLDLTGNNTYTGGTYVNGGVLWLGATTYLADAAEVEIDNGASIVLNSAADTIGSLSGLGALDLGACALSVGANNQPTTHSGVVSGAGSLIKIGTGTLNLLGDNTHSGGTTVVGGRLVISSHLSSLGTGTLTLHDNTSIWVGRADTQVANPVVLNGGPNGINFGLNVSGINSLTFSGPITINGNTTLDVEKKVTFSGSIADGAGGPYSLRKIGSGFAALYGPNTYGGGTILAAGSLLVGHDNALGTGTLTLTNGTSLRGRNADRALPNLVEMSGEIYFGSVAGGSTKLTFNGATTLLGNTKLNISQEVTFAGSIGDGPGGPFTFRKFNSGLLTLSGNNNFTGPFEVQSGSVRLANPDALDDSIAVYLLLNGTLDMQYDVTVDLLFLDGVQQLLGTYNAGNTPGYFTGPYSLFVLSSTPPQPDVIPEPLSLGLLGLGLLGFRRRRR